MTQIDYVFETTRLRVKKWHSIPHEGHVSEDLVSIVKEILSTRVTASLPPAWHGHYSVARAQEWIRERDSEGVTLLVVEKASSKPLGFVILLDMTEDSRTAELRLGYILAETAWGKGFGSELIKGLIDFCQGQPVVSIVGGVAKDNIASQRVLEKNGFVCDPATVDDLEQLYELRFTSDSVP